MGAHPDSGPHTSYKRKRAYDDDDEKQDTFFEYLEETRDRRKSKKKKGEPKETRLRRWDSRGTKKKGGQNDRNTNVSMPI